MNAVDAQSKHARSIELYRAGKLNEAEAILLEILKEDPKSPAAFQLLTQVEWSLGHLPRAILTAEQWLTIEPDNAVAWGCLGAVCQAAGEFDRAVLAYRSAADLAPQDITHWKGLASSSMLANDLNEAVRARDVLLQEFPEHGITHLFDGHIHKVKGNTDGALSAYEKALELTPTLAAAIYNLVDLRAPTPQDPLAEHIEKLSNEAGLKVEDEINLCFSLGRIHEQDEAYDKAFTYYRRANEATLSEMNRRRMPYDRTSVESNVDQAISSYPIESFRHHIDPLPIDLKLIYIVGLPRSGTTLLEQILSSHSHVGAGGELPFAHQCHREYVERRHARGMGEIVNLANSDEVDLLLEMRELYLDRLFELDVEGQYITDKLPGNFEILGFIRLLFPDAIVIHNKRQLLATCWSLYSSNFGAHDSYYNSMENLGHYCRMYLELMRHWRSVLSPPIIEVQYEDIVMRTEQVMRDLLADIGLPWDDKCLAFYENRRPVMTASYNQARQPIYTSSIDRWRTFAPYLNELAQILPTE